MPMAACAVCSALHVQKTHSSTAMTAAPTAQIANDRSVAPLHCQKACTGVSKSRHRLGAAWADDRQRHYWQRPCAPGVAICHGARCHKHACAENDADTDIREVEPVGSAAQLFPSKYHSNHSSFARADQRYSQMDVAHCESRRMMHAAVQLSRGSARCPANLHHTFGNAGEQSDTLST